MVEEQTLSMSGRQILLHALTGGRNEVYRNYFAADLATADGLVCLSLVEQGFMVRRGTDETDKDGLAYFHVTQAGAEAVGLRLP